MPERSWKELWARVAIMDREELVDRCRQHWSTRGDLLRHRLNLSFAEEMAKSPVASPHFFFETGDRGTLVSILKERYPREAADIEARAERICRHHFDLLGYTDLDYGTDIDWHRDRVHHKRTPRAPWFKVRYLDFEEAGDVKITWELNRHQHLVTLAKATLLTGQDRFAKEAVNQWRGWCVENPYPFGVNWASSLEVAFRSMAWLWFYFLLEGSGKLPKKFRAELWRMLAISGRHIDRYLSTYFSPNTHLLGEGVGLFFIGVLCPELPSARRWRERGWQIVVSEARHQVQSDGLHFEQATYYHVYALDFFLHARILAALNGIPIPAELDQTLERMLEALCVLGRTGSAPRLGDDDGGRLFDPSRNRIEHLLDPLSTGAAFFQRGDFKFLARRAKEETLWLLGAKGLAVFDQLGAFPPSDKSVALAAGGLYLMSDPEATAQLIIDAGPQGALTAGHGHADALSVCLETNRGSLLIDPGTFEYAGTGGERNQFRTTSAHNTLVVDGASQAEPRGPFAWVRLPQAKAELWISGETFDLFRGSHDGYTRSPSRMIHRRWVFGRKSQFWLVRDVVSGEGEHALDVYWHFAPGLERRKGKAEVFLAGESGLGIVAAAQDGWSSEVRQGWWSPVYGQKEPASVLRLSKRAKLPAELATLLVPIRQQAELGELLAMGAAEAGSATGYRYGPPGEGHYVIFAEPGEPWRLGPFSSDAEFLYLGVTSQGKSRQLIFCNGSYAEVRGRRIVTSQSPVTRCELQETEAGQKLVCCPEGSVEIKHPLAGISVEFETSQLAGSARVPQRMGL
jgi:hypothetical protein